MQVRCEEVIPSPDICIKRWLCLLEQPSAPFTQRTFVRLSQGEKALLCSYSIKLEAWKPQEDGGLRLSICLTHHPSTMEEQKARQGKGGRGRKTTYWLENCIRNKKYYNHFLPIHHVTSPRYCSPLFLCLQKETSTAMSYPSLVLKFSYSLPSAVVH